MRTDTNRRKHVPRDSKASERREGTRSARRAAKANLRRIFR